MISYSQNKEDLFVLDYFIDRYKISNYKGTLLEIGANDGITFSNSKLLIENGWTAHLVEPGFIYVDLKILHLYNPNVHVYNVGIGDKSEVVKFWQSGCHVLNGNDKGLVSTTNFEETKRWPGVNFNETEIEIIKWDVFYYSIQRPKIDFISIDAEGMDWIILKEIDLQAVGCKVLCIEWNSNPDLLKLFTAYCSGYKLALQNAENLIFTINE